MTRVVHSLIAKTAKEIGAAAYEVLASNDRFYKTWPKQRRFVQSNWHEFIGHARASLLKMLEYVPGTENDPDGPKYRYSQHIRDEVFEALVIDGTHKAQPTPNIHQMRANAGFDSLADVMKSRTGQVLH